jgi:capsid assembly protease
VEAVATYRGVTTQRVLSDFGKGGIFVGQAAVKAGLADRIGSFEGVLAELSAGTRHVPSVKGTAMSDGVRYSRADLDAAIAAGVAAARAEALAVPAVVAPTAPVVAIVDAAELNAREIDAYVSRMSGEDEAAAVTAGINYRRQIAAEKAALAAPKLSAAEEAELEARAARIAAA